MIFKSWKDNLEAPSDKTFIILHFLDSEKLDEKIEMFQFLKLSLTNLKSISNWRNFVLFILNCGLSRIWILLMKTYHETKMFV